MSADTTTGASLIAEQVSQILVQPLEAASVVLAAGPRIFDSSEPLRIPTLTGRRGHQAHLQVESTVVVCEAVTT